MGIMINTGDYGTEIVREEERMSVPTNDIMLSLIRFIRDNDCILIVTDNRRLLDEDEDLSFVI